MVKDRPNRRPSPPIESTSEIQVINIQGPHTGQPPDDGHVWFRQDLLQRETREVRDQGYLAVGYLLGVGSHHAEGIANALMAGLNRLDLMIAGPIEGET